MGLIKMIELFLYAVLEILIIIFVKRVLYPWTFIDP